MSHLMRLWHFLSSVLIQTRMRRHSVGLDVWFLVGSFVYFHTSCVRTAKAVARLRGCTRLSEPSLVAYVISIMISWAGANITCDGAFSDKREPMWKDPSHRQTAKAEVSLHICTVWQEPLLFSQSKYETREIFRQKVKEWQRTCILRVTNQRIRSLFKGFSN